MRYSEIINEMRIVDGFWSCALPKELVSLVKQHGSLRGIGAYDEIFMASAATHVHHMMLGDLGISFAESFPFYVTSLEEYQMHVEHPLAEDEWLDTVPKFQVEGVVIFVENVDLMSAERNPQFMRMVGR